MKSFFSLLTTLCLATATLSYGQDPAQYAPLVQEAGAGGRRITV